MGRMISRELFKALLKQTSKIAEGRSKYPPRLRMQIVKMFEAIGRFEERRRH